MMCLTLRLKGPLGTQNAGKEKIRLWSKRKLKEKKPTLTRNGQVLAIMQKQSKLGDPQSSNRLRPMSYMEPVSDRIAGQQF